MAQNYTSSHTGAVVDLAVTQHVALVGAGYNGNIALGADPADAGRIRLSNGDIIAWEDATECTLTHVDDTGLSLNLALDVVGALTGGTVTSDGALTVTDGVVSFTSTNTTGNGFTTLIPSSAFAAVLKNSHASIPAGIAAEYTGAAPNGAASPFFRGFDTSATRFEVRSNGGIANYQSNDADLSDETVKKDIAPIGSMWDVFKALEIVEFRYNDQTTDNLNVGVIAQQVQSVAPRFVDDSGWGEEEGLLTVFNKDMYFSAMRVLQEVIQRIEALEA